MVVLLRNDGAALLQKRDDKPGLPYRGMWSCPGGHAEPGESPEDCAKREFFEETNYDCSRLALLATMEDHPPNHPSYWLTSFWEQYDGIQSLECHEGQELKFVFRSQVDKHPVPVCVLETWDLALEAFKKRKDNLL